MGQLDDVLRRARAGIGTSSSTSRQNDHANILRNETESFTPINELSNLEDFLSSLGSAASVTSREQIINPDAIIAQRRNIYGNDEAGQLRMQQDLNALRTYAAQQEAAYLEYYNSPEQQMIRDREAGLNPDILGFSGSEGVQANQITNNPTEGVLSEEELRQMQVQQASQSLSAISGIFSSVAQVASIPSVFKQMKVADSQIALNNANTNAINVGASAALLGNIESFEKLAGNEISSRLSDSVSSALQAGQALSVADWFADENNFAGILESYAPDTSPHYAASFANLRKRMQQNLGNAYAQGKITAENQGSFSSLVADPRYSSDQLTQVAMLRPYMAAQAKAELAKIQLEKVLSEWNTKYQNALSVDTAVNAANNKNSYDAAFWDNMDADLQSAFENYKATVESLSLEFNQQINSNLLEIYRQNPNNEKGFSAAYLFRSGSNATLQDYFYSNNMTDFSNMLKNQRVILSQEAKNSERFFKFRSYQPIMDIPFRQGYSDSFGLNKAGSLIWRNDVENYIKTLEKIAESK